MEGGLGGQGTKQLVQLTPGDWVIVQNQYGRFPKRWEWTGTVVEVKDYDQYIIKIHSSGRLTRRNRQFLHLYDQKPYFNSQANKANFPQESAVPTPAQLPTSVNTPREAVPGQSRLPVTVPTWPTELIPMEAPPLDNSSWRSQFNRPPRD